MTVPFPSDCLFYQAMDLPGIGFVEGSWDHRGTEDDYLGHVDFKGTRFDQTVELLGCDLGAAVSGSTSARAEARCASRLSTAS